MLKISIIIPSYNQASYLEETIQSVLSQGYPNLEIIVIDGKSTDGSEEIINKYKDQLTYWVSEKDNGQSQAINKGFQKATGDIITWLCSDDTYTPGTLHAVNNIFQNSEANIGLIHGNSLIFNDCNFRKINKGYIEEKIERILSGMTFPQPSSFIKREYLERAGKLKEGFHYGMDYELFSRLSMICDFKHVDILMSNYRLHSQSKSTTSISKFIDEWALIFNSIITGLKLNKINIELEKLNFSSEVNADIVMYFEKNKTIRKINEDELLYYFLCNVLKYDYTTERFDRCKTIGKYLKEEYSEILNTEPEIKKIINRILYFPPILIKFARNIKISFSQR